MDMVRRLEAGEKALLVNAEGEGIIIGFEGAKETGRQLSEAQDTIAEQLRTIQGLCAGVDDSTTAIVTIARLEEKVGRLENALGVPFPPKEIMAKLAEAATILLDEYDYDGHGWEVLAAARDAALKPNGEG